MNMGFPGYVHEQAWPKWDPDKVVDETVNIAVQCKRESEGRDHGILTDPVERARELAMANPNIQRFTAGKTIVKEIYVPGKNLQHRCEVAASPIVPDGASSCSNPVTAAKPSLPWRVCAINRGKSHPGQYSR